MHTALPHLSMLLSVAFWSSSATAIKFILPVIPVFEAVAFRFTIAATFLWIVVLATSQLRHLRTLGWQPFIAGIIDPGIIAVMAYVALTMTTAVHAVVIMSTMPIFASIFGRIFLKEPLTLPVTGGSLIGLAGTAVLVSDTAMGSKATLIGDGLMVSAVLLICFAQLVLRRVARDRGHPLLMTALMITGGALSGYIALGMFGEATPLAWTGEANTAVWLTFLYTGTFISAAAFFFYNFALRHIQMGRLSLYSVLQTPLGIALAAIVLGESISTVEGAGIVLVIIGVSLPALSNFLKAHGREQTAPPPQV